MSDDGARAGEVTALLAKLDGDEREEALERLMRLVYDELHRLAARFLERERVDHTLQPTALVNEAFLRLAGQECRWESSGHFLAIAATAMRRILVNHARDRGRRKRGGGRRREAMLDEHHTAIDSAPVDLITLDEAIGRLSALAPRKARVVEMRFFVGMSFEQIGEALGVSMKTVQREWRFARAWLQGELDDA